MIAGALAYRAGGELEELIADVTAEGSEDGLVKAQLRRLETAAGDYANSSSESCTGLTEWEA